MKRTSVAICLLLICLLFSISGCGEKKPLQVGFIDTDQLLVRWDKYKNYAEEISRQQQELSSTLPKDPGAMSPSDQMKIAKMKEEWNKKKEELRDDIREAAKVVAREKKLDMILDNSSSAPVIEYGGKDVTNDVLKAVKKLGNKDEKNK